MQLQVRGPSTPASLSCGSITVCSDTDPHSACSLGSVGHSVSRLRDFQDYDMESPYCNRRPSSHSAYVGGVGVVSGPVSPHHGSHAHLPSFHHDPLHHLGSGAGLGVSTLQPNSRGRDRAREALLRRQLGESGGGDSGSQHSGHSGSSRQTTEQVTEQTVVTRQLGLSTPSLHSVHSLHSHHSLHSRAELEAAEHNSDEQLSSEDNLSHESYDLLDKEAEAAHLHSYSDNMKTGLSRSDLSFDNSLSYSASHNLGSHGSQGNHAVAGLETDNYYNNNGEAVLSNQGGHSGAHSSTYSSRQSMNSSGLSASPLPDPAQPPHSTARRRSSGASQKSRSSNQSRGEARPGAGEAREARVEARVSLREGHFLSEDNTDDFQGHEAQLAQQQPGLVLEQLQLHQSRTLPGRGRGKQRPRDHVSGHVFTTGRLSVDCSSASSSSHASPYSVSGPGRMLRPKSLDFSVVALQDLPPSSAFSYRDDTIEQRHLLIEQCEPWPNQTYPGADTDTSDAADTGARGGARLQNYAGSSSDTPDPAPHPQQPAVRAAAGQKTLPPFNCSSKQAAPPAFHGLKQERIYDIPEGIEREELQERRAGQVSAPTRAVFQPITVDPNLSYKNYMEMSRKFSSEESESTSHKPKLKIFPPPRTGLKKVSSTESESALSNNSHQSAAAPVHFDSDTLSLPLDLISPPLESESSTALVDSESLPAPPQFGSSSNRDDTDIEDEVTPRHEDTAAARAQQQEAAAASIGEMSSGCGSLEQPEKSKFGVRVAPLALQQVELVPPRLAAHAHAPRQDSSYETRAERMLESQLSRVDTFSEAPARPGHGASFPREIVDLDAEMTGGRNKLLDNILLKALDSYDSFSNDPLKLTDSLQESLTYEENAESALEKQTTIESFTSQISSDNDVFYDQSIENKVQELNDPNFTNRRDQILESQSTFESFTTECEVLVTKRQESTYEERAETVLESQSTIESFTNEVPNDEVFDHEPPLSESSFLNDDCETQIEAAGGDLVADMYVRQLRDPDTESELLDSVPFMDDSFDHCDLLLSAGGKLACGQGDTILYNNFVTLPSAGEARPESPVYTEPCTLTGVPRSDSNSSLEQPPPLPAAVPELALTAGSETDTEEVTGPYDTEPPLPPDEFGVYTSPAEPLYYRDSGFRGAFPMRTLSRISEKSSNDSASTPSDSGTGAGAGLGAGHSEQEEHNYTTSEDNENMGSISSDLPENMAHDGDTAAPHHLDEVHVEYAGMESNPSSQEESLKNTECTQLDQDTLEDDDDEDLDETNAEEIKTEERDLPPDFKPELTNSITSEADVTNKDSDGSLHDSMEILEEVNTEDRFDHDLKGGSFEASEESQRQIQWRVTLPPKPSLRPAGGPASGPAGAKPGLLKKPSVSLSESSGKYVVTEGTEEIIL